MRWPPLWLSRRFPFLARRRMAAELDEELALHLDLERARQRARGLSPARSERAARIRLGNRVGIRERTLEVWGWRWLDATTREAGLSLRALRRAPGFALAAIVTLGLGIGASAAIFSAVYGVLLRPLPYEDPASIVVVQTRDAQGDGRLIPSGFSGPELDDWIERVRTFETLALVGYGGFAVDGRAGYEMRSGARVSTRFFDIFRAGLLVGTGLGARAATEVVVAHRLAVQQFGDATSALGQGLRVNGELHTIVGVARPDFDLPREPLIRRRGNQQAPQLWVPFGRLATDAERSRRYYHFVGRLRPGASVADAQAEADAIFAALGGRPEASRLTPVVVRLHDFLTASVERPLWLFLGAVGLLWLVAATNVAGLTLARQAARGRELALRKALGASRARLGLHVLAETAWLGLAGWAVGIGVAAGALALLRWLGPVELPRLADVRLDGPVLGVAGVGALAAVGLAALLASLPLARPRVAGWRWGVTGTSAETVSTRRLRTAVVTVQLALSVVLLVGAMLLTRSFVGLLDVDLGIAQRQVLSVQINLLMGRTLEPARRIALTDRVLDRVAALSGVAAVGAANGLPPDQTRMMYFFEDEAATAGSATTHRLTLLNPTPGYFGALGIPLLRGRRFTVEDTATSEPVLVLSASAARRLFGTEDVIGRVLPTTSETKPTIVGVVGDVRYGGLQRDAPATVYQPFAQNAFQHMNLVVRADRTALDLAGAVRAAVHAVDREITIASTNTLEALISDARSTPRLRAALLGSLAALALLVASFGLGGAVAYGVARRRQEIAVRMTVGARASQVLLLVTREAGGIVAIGLAVGLLTAWVASRVLASLLFGLTPSDGPSFALAGGTLLLATLVATLVPARRAASVDPMTSLRAD